MQTMDGIFTNLKRMFQSGNILSEIVYINVGLFILIRPAYCLCSLMCKEVPFCSFAVTGFSGTFALPSVDVVYLYVHSF